MPNYEFKCKDCGYGDEIILSFNEDHTRLCPFCQSDEYDKVYSLGGVYGDDGFLRSDWEGRETYRKSQVEKFRAVGKDPKDYVWGDPDKGVPLG